MTPIPYRDATGVAQAAGPSLMQGATSGLQGIGGLVGGVANIMGALNQPQQQTPIGYKDLMGMIGGQSAPMIQAQNMSVPGAPQYQMTQMAPQMTLMQLLAQLGQR